MLFQAPDEEADGVKGAASECAALVVDALPGEADETPGADAVAPDAVHPDAINAATATIPANRRNSRHVLVTVSTSHPQMLTAKRPT
jgi:hypothetical protein